MMMIASGTFTLANLQLAFDEYISVHGEAKAKAVLKEAVGGETPAEVAEAKMVKAVAVLVSTLTISRMTSRGARRGKSTLAAIHSRLDELREKAFGKAAAT